MKMKKSASVAVFEFNGRWCCLAAFPNSQAVHKRVFNDRESAFKFGIRFLAQFPEWHMGDVFRAEKMAVGRELSLMTPTKQ